MSLDTNSAAEREPVSPRKTGHFLRRSRVAQLGETGLGVISIAGSVATLPLLFIGGALFVDGSMRMLDYRGRGFFGQMLWKTTKTPKYSKRP